MFQLLIAYAVLGGEITHKASNNPSSHDKYHGVLHLPKGIALCLYRENQRRHSESDVLVEQLKQQL